MHHLYNFNGFEILVSKGFSAHKKYWFVSGSVNGILETGGSNHGKEIKAAIKKYVIDNKLQLSENIKHTIYGIYSASLK